MARTKGAKDKQPRKKLDYKEEYLKAKEIISGLDAMIHQNAKDLKEMSRLLKENEDNLNKVKEEVTLDALKNDPKRHNFELAVLILNTTRQTLKQLARQAGREQNPIMASVFEYLYYDMGNIEKYRLLEDKFAKGQSHVPDPVPPVDFTFDLGLVRNK